MKVDRLCLIAAGVLLASSAHGQNAQRGQKLFEECAACHSTERGVNGVGPSLAGALGRKAGENPEFRYSAALRRSGITWSAEKLNEFIADPQKTIPDNRMPYSGMPDAANRADLLAYLLPRIK